LSFSKTLLADQSINNIILLFYQHASQFDQHFIYCLWGQCPLWHVHILVLIFADERDPCSWGVFDSSCQTAPLLIIQALSFQMPLLVTQKTSSFGSLFVPSIFVPDLLDANGIYLHGIQILLCLQIGISSPPLTLPVSSWIPFSISGPSRFFGPKTSINEGLMLNFSTLGLFSGVQGFSWYGVSLQDVQMNFSL